MSDAVVRRLAAILIADVVGYSRLMERNETGTHTRLRAVRDEVTDPAIRASGGRIVRTVGDGLLVEFQSAGAALRAAVAIQREMRARNEGLPQDERIDYRIGINIGDIIVTPEDIEGDGVNLAARLQALADPGGICVSQAVQAQVREDLGVSFVDAGEQRVKNIGRPVQVYRVALEPPTAWDRARARLRLWRRDAGLRGVAAGLGVVALATAASALWWSQRSFSPPRLSVAAVPFAAVPADVQNTQLALALNAELRNGLDRLAGGGLFAVPQIDAGAETDARAIARRLNVRHVLTGTLKRSINRLDVLAQLVDGESGTTVWSDQFWFAQDETNRADRLAAARLSAALRLELLRAEARRAEKKPAAERDATDLGAMAYVVIYGPDYTDRRRMQELIAALADALAREPNNVLALVTLAELLNFEIEYLTTEQAAPLKAEVLALAKRALAVAPNDGEAWMAYAGGLELSHEYAAALEASRRSLVVDPTNVYAMLYHARLLMLNGQFDPSVRQARSAAEIAPQMQDVGGTAALVECQALYYKGSTAEATTACERATGLGVSGYVTSMLLAALYINSNEPAKAAAARDRAMKEFPGLRLNTFFESRNDGPLAPQIARWSSDLKKAGFAE
ncbi:MAG TPA: adenylate/guanylate cyclase domain-containing protein [Burkholderiaceae bacterium]|nr:adenylate/guanylate cyclase domain-containing protein [Burkholderiaceae bacterium]